MVVGLFGAGFPFVDGSAAAFGADEVLGGDLLGEHAMLIGTLINTASLYLQRATAAKVPQPVCWPGVWRIFEVGKMQPATTRSRPPEHRFGSHFPCTGRFVDGSSLRTYRIRYASSVEFQALELTSLALR